METRIGTRARRAKCKVDAIRAGNAGAYGHAASHVAGKKMKTVPWMEINRSNRKNRVGEEKQTEWRTLAEIEEWTQLRTTLKRTEEEKETGERGRRKGV